MSIGAGNQKKLHHDLTNVGLRAQATAAGLVQLCVDLRGAGILDEDALNRIKAAIGDEIIIGAARPVDRKGYRQEVRARLDRLFSGEERMGPAERIAPDRTGTD